MCPSDDSGYRQVFSAAEGPYAYSYVMNSYMSFGTNSNPHVPATVTTPKNNLKFPKNAAWKISQVKSSSDKILVYEEDERCIRDGRGQMDSPPVGMVAVNVIGMLSIRHDKLRILPDDVPNAAGPIKTIDQQVNRERKGNVGFVDGHADYVRRLQLAGCGVRGSIARRIPQDI
jgi:prepilin-type processing-associated H-X9-DG protein